MKITTQAKHTIGLTLALSVGLAVPAHAGSVEVARNGGKLVVSVTLPGSTPTPTTGARVEREIRYDRRGHAYSVPTTNATDDFTGAELIRDLTPAD